MALLAGDFCMTVKALEAFLRGLHRYSWRSSDTLPCFALLSLSFCGLRVSPHTVLPMMPSGSTQCPSNDALFNQYHSRYSPLIQLGVSFPCSVLQKQFAHHVCALFFFTLLPLPLPFLQSINTLKAWTWPCSCALLTMFPPGSWKQSKLRYLGNKGIAKE